MNFLFQGCKLNRILDLFVRLLPMLGAITSCLINTGIGKERFNILMQLEQMRKVNFIIAYKNYL